MIFSRKKAKDINKLIKKAPVFIPTIERGLNDEQINSRIEDGLVNKTEKTVTKSYFEIIFKNVFSILNIILFAIAITMIVFKQYKNLLFLVILSVNIAISLVQDIKARRLVDKLSLISNPRATVVRNAKESAVPFNEIVLSDIIVLKAGNTIPCDGVVVHGEISVNESLLSGENNDVKKFVKSKVYAESVVTSGIAHIRVEKVGKANYVATLQEKAKSFSRPKSEILTSLSSFIKIISIAAVAIGISEIATYLFLKQPVDEAVKSMTSSVVAMIPIGMYLMTSITLTVGVILLARKRILVRELYSIEMLARVNVLCVDKTGTLTDGKMKVDCLIPFPGHNNIELEDLIAGILSTTKDDNLTAKALKEKFSPRTILGPVTAIPFNSARKYSAVSYQGISYVMGAFGFFDITNEDDVNKEVKKYEALGRRVLVLAKGRGNIYENKLPGRLTAIGLIALEENLKPDAIKNIEWFKNNDVSIRIISGDSLLSLQNIAKRVGVEGYEKAISLEDLSDEEVKEAAHKHCIFARVSPDQKKIIIEELRKNNCVAMVGDGVNDLLALKSADCSIAMASGSDAAKAVSHLVSLDSNFSSLPNVVEQGRRVINNLQRVSSIFLVKTIFAITLSTVFLVLSWFDHDIRYPFAAPNLYIWELITIGAAPFFVALEPNKDRIKGKFMVNVVRESVPAAFMQLLLCGIMFVATTISSKYFPRTSSISMAVILITVMSLVIFLKVCMPLNKFRGTVVIVATIFVAGLLLGDYYLATKFGHEFFDISFSSINTATLLLGLISFIAAMPVYFLVSYALNKLLVKLRNRKNNEQARNN